MPVINPVISKALASAKELSGPAYMGIDPGQKGGLVVIYSFGIHYSPMPETERDIWNWVKSVTVRGDTRAVIERVASMPKQGVSSTFTFGRGYGGLRMALIAAGIPFDEVSPQTWQKGLGIPPAKKNETKAQWKNRLRAKAQQLFPSLPIWTEPKSKGRQLAIADALLIAEYNRRKNEGRL